MLIFIMLSIGLAGPAAATPQSVAERLAGRILLQVEERGEAWYVDPVTLTRSYLGRPADAFAVMREFGLGITNADLSTIASVPGLGTEQPDHPVYDREAPDLGVSGYAGIPVPAFGEQEQARPRPSPWEEQEPGYFYVDQYHVDATDLGNSYGIPDKPRRTIPRTLGPGDVVELHGRYDWAPAGSIRVRGQAPRHDPAFVRGADARSAPVITRTLVASGTGLILEHLEFADHDGQSTGKLAIIDPSQYVALRQSDVHGNGVTGGVSVGAWGPGTVSDVLIADNQIHDNGDWQVKHDQDVHGIHIGRDARDIWVLGNALYRNSGDGLQVNAGSRDREGSTARIYVAGNEAHHNKQAGFWAKQSSDVIFSQNTSYAHRPSDSSPGACMGFQYAPVRVWFLYNEVYDCEIGIFAGSGSGLGSGDASYFIGNRIRDIGDSDGRYNPHTAWAGAALTLAGGEHRLIMGNTMADVDAGVNVPGGGSATIVGNVIGPIARHDTGPVFIEHGSTADASSLHANSVDQAGRMRWGSSAPQGLFDLESRSSQLSHNSPLQSASETSLDHPAVRQVLSAYQELYGVSPQLSDNAAFTD